MMKDAVLRNPVACLAIAFLLGYWVRGYLARLLDPQIRKIQADKHKSRIKYL